MSETNFEVTEQEYANYLNRPRRIYNEKLREDDQTFSDAMCEDSIVSGLENGEEILEMIRKAGV